MIRSSGSSSHTGRDASGETHGVDASRQSLAQDHQVRAHRFMVHGQPAASASQTRLHLIGDEQNLGGTRTEQSVTDGRKLLNFFDPLKKFLCICYA